MKINEARLTEMRVVHALRDALWTFTGACKKCGGNDAYVTTAAWKHSDGRGTTRSKEPFCLEEVLTRDLIVEFAEQVRELFDVATPSRRRAPTTSATGSRAALMGAARCRQSRKTPETTGGT